MPQGRRHVIVGAGLAGARTAEALRAQGSDDRIVLIGQEPAAPYHRPPLSKDFLAGETPRQQLDVLPGSWYADNGVELLTGKRVERIDVAEHTVVLSDRRTVGYDDLVIATGSAPRRLDVPGSDADGVLLLRRLEDSERLRAALAETGALVIVGGGWIGLEVASLAVSRGVEVTVVEQSPLPLGRVLGPEMAGVLLGMHRDHGVRFRLGREVEEIVTEGGRAAGVRLADGQLLPADLVLVAVGASPELDLVRGQLEVDDGVLVDEHLRASLSDVYAVGDVANAYHPVLRKRIRVEHWANADRQPAVVAANLLGGHASYDRLPYFFTDQYDMSMEYTGDAQPGSYDRVVVRGDVSTLSFAAFWLAGDRMLAAMSSNVDGVISSAEHLITRAAPVQADQLSDASVDLEELARRAERATTVDLTEKTAAEEVGSAGEGQVAGRPRPGA